MKIHRRVRSLGYKYCVVKDKKGNEINKFHYNLNHIPEVGSYIINGEKCYKVNTVIFENCRMITMIWVKEIGNEI